MIWFKDGNELIIDDNNDNIIIVVEDNMMVRESNLRIVSAGSEDSGDYMCVASNDAGSVESSEILVEVSGGTYNNYYAWFTRWGGTQVSCCEGNGVTNHRVDESGVTGRRAVNGVGWDIHNCSSPVRYICVLIWHMK